MTTVTRLLRLKTIRLFLRFSISFTFLIIAVPAAIAQSSTDAATPLAVTPGAPAGSFALSGFESINAFNGNLNFALPLLKVGGRGGAQMPIVLKIEQRWRIVQEPVCSPCEPVSFPTYNWWTGITPGYGVGVLQGRTGTADLRSCPAGIELPKFTLTRFTFTAADGTEYELRDKLTNGQPLESFSCIDNEFPSRGTVFVTADGSAATFISDVEIRDQVSSEYPTGVLIMRDGMRYRIVDGEVQWMQDRNGNRITFTYEPGPNNDSRVRTITDSLGRQVTIEYDVQEPAPFGLCDRIIFRGFGGVTRIIRISKTSLGNALRSGFSLRTFASLFPELNGASSFTLSDPPVVSAVWLPDGRSYRFFYNDYAELARVELPTGGAIEYDWAAGVRDASVSGVWRRDIYRRVVERRTYPNGGNGPAFESKSTYSRPERNVGACCQTENAGYVQIDNLNSAGTLLSRTKHYFFGYATFDPFNGFEAPPLGNIVFNPWNFGREHQAESLNTDGVTVLRRVAQTWQQREPVSWWTADPDKAPANDPRVIASTTTLTDTNQVTKRTFSYDEFNNTTNTFEHDFGTGIPGPLVRRTHVDYLTVNSVNGVNYATNPDIHIRNLPVQESVFDAGGAERARTTYEYDNYTAGLTDRSNIIGHDTSYNTSKVARGNPTKIARWLLPSTPLSNHLEYDVAGNVVSVTDPRNNTATFDFADRFGAPDSEARGNTQNPPELVGASSFAFPTMVTNPLEHTSFTQYDYHIGTPVNGEDSNGVVSKVSYNDSLDRATELVVAVGTAALQRRTIFAYNDLARTITTQGDQNGFGDGALTSEIVYDGLGRTIEARQYESSASYIATAQNYDGLGRVKQTSNPYRPGTESPLFTTTAYDGLGRVVTVTTPDNAVVRTAYDGARVLVTDQAGKQRISETNALGHLTDVWEVKAADSATEAVTFPNHPEVTAGYRTKYSYDPLDDLIKVEQGSQQRFFMYDSLKRLIRARNPEQETNAALALSDSLSGNNQWCMAYSYDANGNLATRTNARNIVTNYDYDPLNRVKGRTYFNDPQNTPTVSYKYDSEALPAGAPPAFNRGFSTGRLVATTYGGASPGTYLGYDQLGRVTTSYQQTDGQNYGFSYAYNLASALIGETYPSNRTISHSYDPMGRLTGVSGQKTGEGNKTYTSSFSYAAHGAVKSMQLSNGKWEHTDFNSRLQPTQIGLGTSAVDSSLLKLDYTYGTTGNNGNVLTQTITVPNQSGGSVVLAQSYGYDALNRLSSASENAGSSWSEQFSFDRYGNMWVSSDTGIPLSSLTPQSQSAFNALTNRLVASSYDAAGNQTVDGQGRTFDYDAENRQIKFNGTVGQYFYDGDGHRVKKVDGMGTTVFVYNVLGQLVAEYSTSTSPPAGAGGTSYLTTDHLGSTRVVTKADGSVKTRYDYLPFGEEIGSAVAGRSGVTGYGSVDNTKQKFTQKERDLESGLDYLLARYYASPQGRFTSTDILSGDVRDPQNWNLYQYARNNPLIYVDPTGKDYEIYDAEGNFVFRIEDKDLSLLKTDGIVSTSEDGRVINFVGGFTGRFVDKPTFDQFTTEANVGLFEYTFADQELARHLMAEMDENLMVPDPNQNPLSAVFGRRYIHYSEVPFPNRPDPCLIMFACGPAMTSPTRSFPLGRGSTGRTVPNNLTEQLAMEQVRANPLAGGPGLSEGKQMSDPRWPASEGWVKLRQNVNGVEIHYVYNTKTGQVDDFKFK